ncbi:MAG: glycosyl hydrolase [Acidobacteria bacterium 13_1_40CM_3_55_6]|nr:MAG: glycosyl hydrolase [Acidobacteria bacterium 13_1_40CM_3_55_6]
MFPSNSATLNPSKFFLALSLTALIVLVPLSAFGQRDNKSAKTEAEKPASQETARQQPSPVPVKPDESKKPEQAASEDESKPRDPMSTPTFNGLKFRSIGPAFTSGRVIGFAVEPNNPAHFFVASASGGVWKTVNDGTTWTPVFDREGSYSIGAIALDPKNPLTVWVGTGENNSQRSVSYGSGLYRSDDGGKTWKNVGLKTSEHIGRIAIDPKDSNVVYVAAQGPLWGPGGDRGLFKTTDGGKTWKHILNLSENTGVTDVVIDLQNPETIYAASYQRRRHMFTLIDGGPESAIYKSTDAGTTWNKLRAGLPTTEMGRIGLAISPVDSNVIYATIEAADRKGGIFRSNDRGGSWERRNEFDAGAMYYARLVADPKDVDRVYVMNVFLMVSDDGGRTVRRLGEKSKHVDNHEIWIDPNNTDHYLVGCDGGVYESYDRGANWDFKRNLPVTQLYDVTTDNAAPFYNVFGGAQDNFAFGGPSRTHNASGIVNSDWWVTQGGDGFRTQVDPEDPNTIYAELQNGNLVRDDKRTGERMGIQPEIGRNEDPLRWNWDSPFIISPHSHTRIYFAADKLFRSDDRGDTWQVISGQLSRALDRDKLPVMGKVWSMDAVAKNQSTAFFGNASALAESPKKEGLIYVGTDDGLIQITEDGGKNWRKVEKLPDVPELAYVSRVVASNHDANTVYVAVENHQNADFKPYLFKSADAGRTWTSIKANLPANHPVWAIAEDHVDPNLLFVGTEFGLFFSIDGGQKWIQLKGGLPTIQVRDIAIQRRENDLVLGTFGRGFYILDNYTPLRLLKQEMLKQDALLFPVKDSLMYIQAQPIGGRGKSFQGESFFTAENPPFGATFTYYLKEELKTKKVKRQEAEKDAQKKNAAINLPSRAELRAEEEEEAPAIIFTVTDSSGRVVRRLTGPITAGMQRVAWDLRYAPPSLPPPPNPEAEDPFNEGPAGPLVMPGTYKVSVAKRVDGVMTPLGQPQEFQVVVEGQERMTPADRTALVEFQQKVARLQRALQGALEAANALTPRFVAIRRALLETPNAPEKLLDDAAALEKRKNEILRALRGDQALRQRNMNLPPSINERVGSIVGSQRMSTSRPTQTQMDQYAAAAQEFQTTLNQLRQLIEADLQRLEKQMEAAGAPWTPGRIPEWKDQ